MNKEDLVNLFEKYIGTISESVKCLKDPNYYYTDLTGYKVGKSISLFLDEYYKKDNLVSRFMFDVFKKYGPNVTLRFGHFDRRSPKKDGIYIYIEFPKEIKQTEYIITLELGNIARYSNYPDKYDKNIRELQKIINFNDEKYSQYIFKRNEHSSIVCYKTDNYSIIPEIIDHIKNNYYFPIIEKIKLKDGYWESEEWETFQKNTFGDNYVPIEKKDQTNPSNNVIDREDENIYKTSQNQKEEDTKTGFNRLYYGVPGCGKSYYIEHNIEEIVGAKNKDSIIKIRTVFYPDYSNSDFVGQILPISENNTLKYKPIPGPFTIALKKSAENRNKKVVLIIEEINRGNASAIFGDIFQLLDRKGSFSIENNFISQFAKEKGNEMLNNFIKQNGITLPDNLYIIGTMNTSDQNVYTLDTAFKRRWEMYYYGNAFNDLDSIGNMIVPNSDGVLWSTFVDKINESILDKSNQIIQGEDKQLGKYFVSEGILIESNDDLDQLDEKDKKSYCTNIYKFERFRDKVLVYLFDDVTKYNHSSLFHDDINSIDKLMSKNKLEDIIKVSFDEK
ncbi:MAG: AAA family ATPase [Bacilli bacterium]|nr:AAA family ATPase [Bacilli bacterium]